MDVIIIAAVLVFFAVAVGFVVFCDRVVGAPAPISRDGPESERHG